MLSVPQNIVMDLTDIILEHYNQADTKNASTSRARHHNNIVSVSECHIVYKYVHFIIN